MLVFMSERNMTNGLGPTILVPDIHDNMQCDNSDKTLANNATSNAFKDISLRQQLEGYNM